MGNKILFSCLHRPDRSPSQRFRFEQYLDFLEENGHTYHYSYLISEKDDQRFYAPGHYFYKLFILLKSLIKRFLELFTLSKYDVIYVQREAFMLGTTFFERYYAKANAKFIFDFDDSIWLQNVSNANKALSFLKNAKKTDRLIAMADLVITGNQYLKDYALQFNENIWLVPTTVDTQKFTPKPSKKTSKAVCIGWSGSHTTIEHFKTIVPVLLKIKSVFGSSVYFKVIGDPHYINEELDVKGIAWSSATEVKEMQEFDIGIMPLPDNEWTKGKCGLKGLTYMALEIPTIMSEVGANKEIVEHGKNGFLCATDQEWFDLLSQLITLPELRKQVSANARKTVLDSYSVQSQKEYYLKMMITNDQNAENY